MCTETIFVVKTDCQLLFLPKTIAVTLIANSKSPTEHSVGAQQKDKVFQNKFFASANFSHICWCKYAHKLN